MLSLLRHLILIALLLGTATGCADGYPEHAGFAAFAQKMETEHGFDRQELERLFATARRKDSILEAIARPAERVLDWGEYRQIFLTDKRVEGGIAFWREHQELLERAAAELGVEPQIIVAIIGVETRYGGNMGSYRVLDALSTLGFDYPPRSEFFLGELEQFLLLSREQGFDPQQLKGSYAGAMGMGQFIPSSYRAYAIDFDGDGKADIWNNPADAIGSVANYFREHGWRSGEAVTEVLKHSQTVDDSVTNGKLKPGLDSSALEAAGFKPPAGSEPGELFTAMRLEVEGVPEYWLGRHNFYVITRYNHSHLYAMAVYQLSEEIRRGFAAET